MNTYRITGTDRQIGAIGITEPYIAIVRASSAKLAIEKNRAERYAAGRDTSLTKKIEVKTGRVWVNIPMLQALELE